MTINKEAMALAEQFNLDAADLNNAYKNKPESLSAHYNAASTAKQDRGWYVGWSIVWGVLFFPVAAYPLWRLYQKQSALYAIDKTLRSEIEFSKRGSAPAPSAS